MQTGFGKGGKGLEANGSPTRMEHLGRNELRLITGCCWSLPLFHPCFQYVDNKEVEVFC